MSTPETLELWGGVECTVNRIGDEFFDQVRKSGHHDRPEDIARFASVGFRAMRYPVLWERVAPEGLDRADWAWTDDRLERLRAAGIRPVATLLHHGSGPRTTHLLDPGFPEAFAEYAGAVATRYPWLEDYTPVNEPLTTARFSTLYGHWYPHHRDDRSFVTALLHELRAIVLAMARIREVTPGARLIQTEDAGRTYSTPGLALQAEFENHRRWLTTDFLTGRVTERHPLWEWLVRCGARRRDIDWLLDHHCPPAIVGLNYYLTSDRYLDERIGQYPAASHGGNGHERYADIEAVRVAGCEGSTFDRILDEAWERYGLPVALTEVHAACTREDQLRWLAAGWHAASLAKARGVDVRAVTMWSLLGAFDWNSLVVRDDHIYEVGAFDLRSTPPRSTALTALAKALANGTTLDPLSRQPGWWQRIRGETKHGRVAVEFTKERRDAPILIAGGTGTLGSALARACETRGLQAVALPRQRLDITSGEDIRRALDRWRPCAVINAAAYVRVDEADAHRDACWPVNTDGAEQLAIAAAAHHARYVMLSTDLVFDGQHTRPYVETDPANPLNVYGASKHAAEERIQQVVADALIVRTAAFFSPADPCNFLTRVLCELSAGREVVAAHDVVISPTYVPHLTDAMLDLLIDGERGIWHLANDGAVSWADFAVLAVQLAGLDATLVRRAPLAALGLGAARPRFSALASERGQVMPSLESAVREYLTASACLWRKRGARIRVGGAEALGHHRW
jgi:dTDP-4-dehydrorhamnose reductase